MKIIKQNKSLCFLLIVSFIYVFATIFFINTLREKNNKLEETKSEILISQQEQKYIQTFSQNKKLNSDDKLAEDIVFNNKIYELKPSKKSKIHDESDEFEELGFCRFLIKKNILDQEDIKMLKKSILGE